MVRSHLSARAGDSVRRRLETAAVLAVLLCGVPAAGAGLPEPEGEPANAWRPASEEALRDWLENMYVYHGFTPDEMSAATGLSADEIRSAVAEIAGVARPTGGSQNDDPRYD